MKIEIDIASADAASTASQGLFRSPPRRTGWGKRTAASARRAAGTSCAPRSAPGSRSNAVFVRRRPTGEVWTPELHAKYPGRDWMLTRILWLSGCEPGSQPPRRCRHDAPRTSTFTARHDFAELGKPGSHRLHPHAQRGHRRVVRPRASLHSSGNQGMSDHEQSQIRRTIERVPADLVKAARQIPGVDPRRRRRPARHARRPHPAAVQDR